MTTEYRLVFEVAAALERGGDLSTPHFAVGARRDRDHVPIPGEYICTTIRGHEVVGLQRWDVTRIRHHDDRYGLTPVREEHEGPDVTAFAAALTFVRETGENATRRALAENERRLRDELEWRGRLARESA